MAYSYVKVHLPPSQSTDVHPTWFFLFSMLFQFVSCIQTLYCTSCLVCSPQASIDQVLSVGSCAAMISALLLSASPTFSGH